MASDMAISNCAAPSRKKLTFTAKRASFPVVRFTPYSKAALRLLRSRRAPSRLPNLPPELLMEIARLLRAREICFEPLAARLHRRQPKGPGQGYDALPQGSTAPRIRNSRHHSGQMRHRRCNVVVRLLLRHRKRKQGQKARLSVHEV